MKMAFASSRIEAQWVKTCDLCGHNDTVNWYCIDCFENLCERCKKGHLKIVTCKYHRLLPYAEAVAITRKHSCKQHMEAFSFFCRTFEMNVCSTCLSTIHHVHRKHYLVDLRYLQTELDEKLHILLKEKEAEQMQMTTNLNALEECANLFQGMLTQNYATIDDRIKALHIAVDAEGHKFKTSLKRTTAKTITKLEERKRMVETNRDVYHREIQTVKGELTSKTVPTFDRMRSINSKLRSLEPMVFSVPTRNTFTIGKIDMRLIRDMMGIDSSKQDLFAEQADSRHRVKRVLLELEIVSDSFMDRDDFHSICSSPDGTLWIGGDTFVYKMSSDCSTKFCCIEPKRLDEEFNGSCRYIACLNSDDAVISFGGGTCNDMYSYNERSDSYMYPYNVRKCTSRSDGRMGFFVNTSSRSYTDDLPEERSMYDISITENNLVVFAASEGDFATEYFLDMFNDNGSFYKTIHTGKIIGSFCINKNGNFIISDAGSACLTTLDEHGKVVKETQISKSNLQRMVCDGYGNIFGVSGDRKEVHLFSDDGKFERSFPVKCDQFINDICIGIKDRLYVLVDKKAVIVANYLK